MFWADFDQGLASVRDRMREYARRLGGAHWAPAPLLTRLADEGRTFTGYAPTLTYEGLYGLASR